MKDRTSKNNPQTTDDFFSFPLKIDQKYKWKKKKKTRTHNETKWRKEVSWRAGTKKAKIQVKDRCRLVTTCYLTSKLWRADFHFFSYFPKKHFLHTNVYNIPHKARKYGRRGRERKKIHELRIKLHLYKNRSFLGVLLKSFSQHIFKTFSNGLAWCWDSDCAGLDASDFFFCCCFFAIFIFWRLTNIS